MKALTLTQPWATGIVLGYKRVETRSWRTAYRGPIAIHAAKGFPKEARAFADSERMMQRLPLEALPLGVVLATAQLVACLPTEDMNISDMERLYGDYSPGRWAWVLEQIEVLPTPIPAKGALGLWEWKSLTVR